jgi:DNA adenine methylase
MFQTPLRYPGGKTFLAKEFERILGVIGLNRPVYVEPYAGGAGAALALLFADKVEKIVINDYDPSIFAFWKAATERSEWFARKIQSTPVSVKEWRKQKKIYSSDESDMYERGFATFFLNRTNRSGVMNAGPIGGMEQDGNYKIDARYNKRELSARIRKIGRFNDRIEVRKEEGIKVTREYLARSNTFIYLDPPYFKNGAMLYRRHYKESDHQRLAKLLNGNRNKHWLLTYDERSQIRQLYNDRYRQRLPLKYRVRGSRKAYELMIFSDSIL